MGKRVPNIWIIDDDPMSSFMLKRLAELGELADIITIYDNPRAALEYIEGHSKIDEQLPDIIFLDIYMPVVNGWDFLALFKKIKPDLTKHIHIIVVSSSNHPKDMKQAESFEEVSAYAVKPVSLDKLKELIGDARA